MSNLFVGVGSASIHVRHSQSLKDKRSITKSLSQKLKNEGFSVVEYGDADDLKNAKLGFSFVGQSEAYVNQKMKDAKEMFWGDFALLGFQEKVFDFTEDEEQRLWANREYEDERS